MGNLINRRLEGKLNFLICTLYTLLAEDKIFKDLNMGDNIYLRATKNTLLSNKIKNFNDFYSLINNLTIRRFAYILIRPILLEKYEISAYTMKNVELREDTILLKKYLVKFRFNYNRYFVYNIEQDNNLMASKEINSLAIESLFFLTGI